LDGNSAYEAFNNQQKLVSDKLLERKQHIEKIEDSFQNLDTTMNFKVNSLLKAEFEQLCKKSHSNPSREIKLFMLKSIKNNSI
jgi:organic hydroperoxide reductase OsmC/OhrA